MRPTATTSNTISIDRTFLISLLTTGFSPSTDLLTPLCKDRRGIGGVLWYRPGPVPDGPPTKPPAGIPMDAIEQPPLSEPTSPQNPTRRLLAYSVHVFTASGSVFGVLALLAILKGNLSHATVYLLITLAIDSVDGSIARRVGVTTHAPGIDGRRMDDIVDFLNFVIVPVVFMVQAGSLPSIFWVIPPVLASAFGFSRRDAKTDDDFFLGWPSYWNVLAFYLWLLELSPVTGAIWVAGLSIAIFIPWKYIYPSKLRNPWLRHGVSWSGVLWAIAVGVAALNPESSSQIYLVEISLAYPAAYMGLSLWMGGWSRA